MKLFNGTHAAHTAPLHLDPDSQAILTRMEDDWRVLLADSDPRRRFDPRLLDDALPYAFLLERTAPGALRTRVAGQKLHDYLNMDPRGMSFGAFFTPEVRDAVIRLAEAAFDSPAIVGVPLVAKGGITRKTYRAEALLLPLRGADGKVTRVIGALIVAGDTVPRGLRFRLAPGRPLRCDPVDIAHAERRTYRAKRAQMAQEKTGPQAGAGLRVVVDNT